MTRLYKRSKDKMCDLANSYANSLVAGRQRNELLIDEKKKILEEKCILLPFKESTKFLVMLGIRNKNSKRKDISTEIIA